MHLVLQYSILATHLESPGELSKMPMLGPHDARGLGFSWSGIGAAHQILLNSLQVILMWSQGLEPLI